MFSRTSRLASLAAILATLSIPSSAAVTLGTILLGFGYAPNGGFCCYGPYDGFYGPLWGPFGPYYPAGYFARPGPDKGNVKLIKANKDAAVYIDNAYAGKVSDVKTISIEPGAYDLELRMTGQDPIHKRIYVLSGKTLKLEF